MLTFDSQLVKPINYDPDLATLAVAKNKKINSAFFYLHTFLGDMNRRKIVKTIETSLVIYYPLKIGDLNLKSVFVFEQAINLLIHLSPFFILYVDESIDTYLPINYYYS